MALKKCPRCELNYILDGGSLCTVCREEVHGYKKDDDEPMLCSVCGEATALPGEDMCRGCLSELKSLEITSADTTEDADINVAELESESLSDLDETDDAQGDDDLDNLVALEAMEDGEPLDDADEEEEDEPTLHRVAEAR